MTHKHVWRDFVVGGLAFVRGDVDDQTEYWLACDCGMMVTDGMIQTPESYAKPGKTVRALINGEAVEAKIIEIFAGDDTPCIVVEYCGAEYELESVEVI